MRKCLVRYFIFQKVVKWCKCTQDYSNTYKSMIHTNHFSPRDYDNLKYIPYTFEDLRNLLRKQKIYIIKII